MIKWYGHVKRRDEGHVLRRMLNAPEPAYQEREGEEDRKPGGKRYGKCGVKKEDTLDRTKWKNDIQYVYHSGDRG